jgi:hypothetical protein
MAQGGSDMGFAHSGRSDEDQVGRFFEPLGVEKLQDFIPGDSGVKVPVKLFEEFDPLDARLAKEMFNPVFLPQFLFLGEEALEKRFFRFGKVLGVGAEFKLFPQVR